ncbi:MAG TPA: ComF family protein [Rhodanobacteraceae bacterium]|nr:ComF family protein [Rhodanobacteraceae bacterium]
MAVNLKTARSVDGLRAWRPARCLLCGVRGARGTGLCEACASELPRNDRCCARCALPMELSAPLCGRCARRAPQWDSAWAPFRYEYPLDRLEARFKFGGDLAAGRVLAQAWCESIAPSDLPQAIVPVPLHRARLRSRGYNQSLELAKPLSKSLHVPLLRDALQRTRATAAQSELTAVQRRRNVRGAFVAHFDHDPPQHLAILDDVFTTGATLAECARVLKRAGVKRVDVWALARAPTPG